MMWSQLVISFFYLYVIGIPKNVISKNLTVKIIPNISIKDFVILDSKNMFNPKLDITPNIKVPTIPNICSLLFVKYCNADPITNGNVDTDIMDIDSFIFIVVL